MSKEKPFNIFKHLYGIIMVIIFTAFCLTVTCPEGAEKLKVLENRMVASLIFIIPGFISLMFKDWMLKIFYTRNGLVFRDENSKQKALKDIKYFGTYVLTSGVAILVFGLIIYAIL